MIVQERLQAPEHTGPGKIDVALILTTGFEGELVKRAVQKALGEEVIIKGSSIKDLKDYVTLPADGAALVALRLLEGWIEICGDEQGYGVGLEHNEL